MSVAGTLTWIQLNRRWIAIGIALVMPWVWLAALDIRLRRLR